MGRKVKVGSRVYWDDPDDGICSGAGVVSGIDGEVVSLVMDDGGEVEAYRSELTAI